MRINQKCCCLLLALALVSSTGCAKKADEVKAQYYPACHEPLAYLHQRSGVSGKAVASGAVQGGVISGIASAIIGAIAGGISGSGVAVSVGVGSALGGALGAANSASYRQMEDNKHLAAYLEQIDGDIEGLNIVTAAATVSEQCYNREFNSLLGQMRSGNITQAAAKSRFEEIVAGEKETAQLLNKPADTARLQTEFTEAEITPVK